MKIVRFDIENEEPVRGPDGFCIPCQPGEVGEIIGQILNDPAKPANRFEGYADRAATERKILRDVFEKGDAWFRSGDLLKKDKDGYFYFIDRIGDTFRWKGENVATSEVAEALTVFPGIADCTVYGVKVDGFEGRAGMAAIVLDDTRTSISTALRDHLKRQLPDYARPVFLRVRAGARRHRHLQAAEDRTGEGGLRPHDRIGSHLLRRSARGPVRAAGRGPAQALESGSIRI